MYTVITSLEEKHIPQLVHLYAQCFWAGDRTQEEAAAIVRGSTHVFGLVDDGDDLVGFARVLSDGVFRAYLYDVVVDETLRGEGLGVLLMNAVLSHPQLAGIERIGLDCKEEMIPWYSRFGFSVPPEGYCTMRRTNT